MLVFTMISSPMTTHGKQNSTGYAGNTKILADALKEAKDLENENELWHKIVINYTKKLKRKSVNRYTTVNLNLRSRPDAKGKNIILTIPYNSMIEAVKGTSDDIPKDWSFVRYNGKYGFVNSTYLSKKPISVRTVVVNQPSSFKSFMPYTAITSSGSWQKLIQSQFAYTGNYGIRMVNGRYCVALGTGIGADKGQYFDLVLQNGTVIPCILSDVKANQHTKSDNITTAHNGCVSEFIVDSTALTANIRNSGNVSSATHNWNSPVKEVHVYINKKIL